MKILTIPKHESTLRKKSKELEPDLIMSADMQKFFKEFKKTISKEDGVGLAAPQVNNQIRVIAINIDNQAHTISSESWAKIFINPKITKKSLFKDVMEEGCLSVPNVYGKVKRHKKITLEYFDEHAKLHKTKFKKFPARVIQHEIDHLNGVLFIDKMVK